MEKFFTTILEYATQGGPAAIIAILIGIIAGLVYERIKMCRNLMNTTQLVYDAKDKETTSIREIIDKYYQGNIDLVNALNEIKMVLLTIQNTKR